jgi:hypothetical protein
VEQGIAFEILALFELTQLVRIRGSLEGERQVGFGGFFVGGR